MTRANASRRPRDPDPPAAAGYAAVLARLSAASVTRRFDAYADIDWDAPDFRIDPTDRRWQLPADDPLGQTDWYRTRPVELRARLGLHLAAEFMKVGVQFESALMRGLLEFAADLPSGAPEFRYAYHEVAEEAQHGLMFQEFIRRSGLPVRGLSRPHRAAARRVARLGRTFPELFFVFVLAGEDPIDHVQRAILRADQPRHPLLCRIMRIHVTEEARHLCFAREFLRQRVPRLAAPRRLRLALSAPCILATASGPMLRPSADVVRRYAIPRAVMQRAYTRNPQHRDAVRDAIAGVRDLLDELGLITPVAAGLWRLLGLDPRAA
ncbi:MAG: diiron oxygenase [Planctomycetes bacterium]|nr:diiron oxygenase [Planctomycetota bacterium]